MLLHVCPRMVYGLSTLLIYTLSYLLWTWRVICTRGRGLALPPLRRDTRGQPNFNWRTRRSSWFLPKFSGLVLSPSLARYSRSLFLSALIQLCQEFPFSLTHSLTLSLSLSLSLSLCLCVSVLQLATWLDSSVSSVSSQLEQKAQHFSELSGETITGLQVSELFSAVVTESGKIYWW